VHPSETPPEPASVPPIGAGGTHVDDEVLALRALGEPAGTSADDAHLAGCARCQVELDQLRAVVTTSRSLRAEDQVQQPPASVWAAIQTEVLPEPAPASVTALDGRRQRRAWSTGVLVAASVASLVAGAVITTVVTRDGTTPGPAPTTQVVAAASLAALPDHSGSGEAQIVTRDGVDYLRIDAADLSRGKGFYEVWLIDPKTMQMVGLGALDTSHGLFPVPTGLDLSKYRLVDVSLEPMDGEPTHSGNSIVRGELAT
jgi:hypothetical protein